MHVVAYLAHADDEVLGCGGLLAKLASEGHQVSIVLATDGIFYRAGRVDNSVAARKAAKILGVQNIFFLGFRDQHFDNYPLIELNRGFEKLHLEPDLLITHAPSDVNQDHLIVFRSAMVVARPTFRRINIIGCEIPSSTEWASTPFSPSLYVDISDHLEKKIEAMRSYVAELRQFPHPRSVEGIQIKARQRGMEVGLQAAEAYQVLRWFAF